MIAFWWLFVPFLHVSAWSVLPPDNVPLSHQYECSSPVSLNGFALKLQSGRPDEALNWTQVSKMEAAENGRLTMIQISRGGVAPFGRLAVRFGGDVQHIRLQPLTVDYNFVKSLYPRLSDRLSLPPLQESIWNLNKDYQVFVDMMVPSRDLNRRVPADVIHNWFQFDQIIPRNFDFRSLLVQGVIVFTDDRAAFIFSRNFFKLAICQRTDTAPTHRDVFGSLFRLLGNPNFAKFLTCEALLSGSN